MDIFFLKEEIEHFMKGEPVSREYSHFSESDCQDLEIFLGSILRMVSMEFLLEIIFTVLNELLVNAFKANAKRIYFEKIGKDINDASEYEKNLGEFRNEFGEFRMEMIHALERSDYKINLQILNTPDSIQFQVSNNSRILNQEVERINARLESSKKIRNLTEAYSENLDTIESSGLGIVLIKLLLKNTGIIENNFAVFSSENTTTVSFEIPKTVLPSPVKKEILNIIQEKIESIPPFPRHTQQLMEDIKSKKISISQVASEIQKEPGLAVEVLKLANSPIFAPRSPIYNLGDAIHRIGLVNLEKILYALGMKSSFPQNTDKTKVIWDHSVRTAYYAIRLVSHSDFAANINKALVSTGGLIHDLGRMALATIDGKVYKILDQLRVDKILNQSEFIEEISLGSSHSEIGSLLADKWNFPEELKQCILYHHRPWFANSKYKNEVMTIYLADFLANQKRKPMNYAIFDPDILKHFRFANLEELMDFETKISSQYDEYIS